jgi:hypothetical protein
LSASRLSGQRQVASRRKLDKLAVFGVYRLEARYGEHHEAVAARADLALDVVEILNHDLGFLRRSPSKGQTLATWLNGCAPAGRSS